MRAGTDDAESDATQGKDEDDEGDAGDKGGEEDEGDGALGVLTASEEDVVAVEMPTTSVEDVEAQADRIRRLFTEVQKLLLCGV